MSNLEQINSIYNKFGTPLEWQHEVDGLVMPFNPEWKNIAVNVSGGADSACGTSILASLIQKTGSDCKIHFITHVRVWHNRPWAGPISIDVYNKIKEMFPDVIGERLQNFIPPEIEEGSAGPTLVNGKSGDRVAVNSFNKYCAAMYNLDAIYNTVTLNPIDKDFLHESAPHDRNVLPTSDFKKNPLIWKNENGYMSTPFKFIEKDWVIAQYMQNNWMDLLNITRSCEGDKTLYPDLFVDYTEYKHGETDLPECGKCFWCAERKWATEKATKRLSNNGT